MMFGTVKQSDYNGITDGVNLVQGHAALFQGQGCRIEIPHPHRWWEYGTAVQLFINRYGLQRDRTVLDVGSGWGVVGPTLAMAARAQVTECEPDGQCRDDRFAINKVLYKEEKPKLDVKNNGFGNLPMESYDAVFCISVLEHVAPLAEASAWTELAARVKKGGLLFITTDCMPFKARSYVMDNLRAQNFTIEDLKARAHFLQSFGGGFDFIEEPDYQYNGPMVFDYTFCRIGLIRKSE